MAYAKAKQQARGIGRALGLYRRQQVIHRLVLPPFAPDDVRAAGTQAKHIGGPFQPAKRKEFSDGLVAQPLNIERAAADEVL